MTGMDDGVVPFEMPGASLVIGTNRLSVTTYAANVMQSQLSYTMTVR